MSGAAKDEMVLEEKDEDGNEVPLGMMMKILKSRGAKKKKNLKKRTSPSDRKELENEVDVLGVVREINLDNMKSDQSMEIGGLTKDNDLSESRPMSLGNSNEEVSVSWKMKETNGIAILSMQTTPKRKRSTLIQRSLSKSTKGQSESKILSYSRSNKRDKKSFYFVEKLTEKDVEPTDSDLLVFQLPTIKSNSNKDVDKSKIGGAIVNDLEVNLCPCVHISFKIITECRSNLPVTF